MGERAEATIVVPGDPRYADLAGRGSRRFAGRPDQVWLAGSTGQVVDALQDAVRRRLRVAVRSGGHCLENFVADPAVRVVIDTSLMTAVSYDAERNAIGIEPGVRLGEAYRRLFLQWGVTIPAGVSPNVGIGGHVLGGGFGYLCRQYGLAADHLYGVEVVVVDETGTARRVTATRDPDDENRDLWWAHTGGGGGNFGIVTRYWFRSPDAAGTDPARLLPPAPTPVLTFRAGWNWPDVDRAGFGRLVRNYGDWAERNSDASSPFAQLYSTLVLNHRRLGTLELTGVTTAGAAAERLVTEHLDAVGDGVGAPCARSSEPKTWLEFALDPAPGLAGAGLEHATFKLKDALLRRGWTDRQIEVAHDHLTRTDGDSAVSLGMATYGGRINTVAAGATASAHRDAVLTTSVTAAWQDPAQEAPALAAARHFYRDLFAGTGGVPVPGQVAGGASINHPDIDLADPGWNTSGHPWHAIYYRDNYPRLQAVKRRWDPCEVFHHALSVRPADAPVSPGSRAAAH